MIRSGSLWFFKLFFAFSWNLNLMVFCARKCLWYPFSCDMGLDGTLTSHIELILSKCHLNPSRTQMDTICISYYVEKWTSIFVLRTPLFEATFLEPLSKYITISLQWREPPIKWHCLETEMPLKRMDHCYNLLWLSITEASSTAAEERWLGWVLFL